MEATAKDLRFHSTELLNTVKRGEEVVITFHGKPCAKLVPIDDNSDRNDALTETNKLFGIWKDDTDSENVEEYIRKLRKGRFNAD